MKYTYEQLIDAYFREIGQSMSNFSTNNCREYVKKYKGNFNEQRFMKKLAERLVEIDDELSDYSLDSDYEKKS